MAFSAKAITVLPDIRLSETNVVTCLSGIIPRSRTARGLPEIPSTGVLHAPALLPLSRRKTP